MILLMLLVCVAACADVSSVAQTERGFVQPPASARPWVYWFWLNSNITREGITADLEAMARAGIGGVLIMEVDQGAPVGPVSFAGPKWRELYQYVCSEAARLGLKVNMNNDAGWCGSGGPWVTPEQSMQKLVWTQTTVTGPSRFEQVLASPQAVANYYRDVAVLAYPTPPAPAQVPLAANKAYVKAVRMLNPPATWPTLPANAVVPRDQVRNLTAHMSPDGKLTWDVPAGQWTILRFGHTSTGHQNHPAPASGCGLECDKLSRAAVEAHFNALIGTLARDVGALAGRSFVSTHIDSWEVGVQNWTADFRKQFKQRRGYDPLPWLPVVTGRVVGSMAMSERFLWDLRKTVSELLMDHYAGYMRKLAHRRDLRLSIEAYHTCLTNELAYAGRADEPMGEFWSWGPYGAAFSCTEMTSAGHVYGRRIIGAEAFTAGRSERWLGHPGNIKALGDWAFCEGINRFVFHRYAMQPWRDRRPGMTMGPWGLHYERTQTWWEQSGAWHRYLARCQYLLRQGLFVADLCLMTPEGAPQSIAGDPAFRSPTGGPLERPGHNFDLCPPEVVLNRMSVRDGRLVLPDGMSYRVLVLPNAQTMTPRLLAKIKQLIEDGATVIGAPPLKSPSLVDYPQCDAEVERLATTIWGATEPPDNITEHRLGKGRVFWGGELTAGRPAPAASSSLADALWIWHDEGNPVETAPPGTRYFRRIVEVPDSAGKVTSATLSMTADNAFTCWINGRRVGSGDDFKKTYVMNVGRFLHPGKNIIAVAAHNGAQVPNPAALIAVLVVKQGDGHVIRLHTDASWSSAKTVPDNWKTVAAPDGTWTSARQLGAYGMAPWGKTDTSHATSNLYPDIVGVGRFLDRLDVPPDFASRMAGGTAALRYIHRAADDADYYFVANKTTERQAGVCAFRIAGRRPEFWWPRTGRIEQPAVYDQRDGRTIVPLCLEPQESVFVVFRKDAAIQPDRLVTIKRNGRTIMEASWRPDGSPPVTNDAWDVAVHRSPDGKMKAVVRRPGDYVFGGADGAARHLKVGSLPAACPVAGPWDVRFTPGWGAPERATFAKLVPWNRHPDSGIKYYSGVAVYTTNITVPEDLVAGDRRLVLDLGRVEVMATVEVNGQPLGTLWKAPYRLDVTGAMHAGRNQLKITVANLWINRMIGDEQLPEDSERNANGTLKKWPDWLEKGKPSPTGRYTFTTWRLWPADAPLVDSGLIGPVELRPLARRSVKR